MKKYIVIYHAPEDMMKQAGNLSPDDRKKEMESWMAWADKCGDKLIDLGSPLMGGVKLSPDGNSSMSRKDVTGYSVIQAESMDEAKMLLGGHPHLQYGAGCEIEIHEAMPLPGV